MKGNFMKEKTGFNFCILTVNQQAIKQVTILSKAKDALISKLLASKTPKEDYFTYLDHLAKRAPRIMPTVVALKQRVDETYSIDIQSKKVWGVR